MKVLKIFLLFQTVASLLQYSTKPVFITGANSQVGRRVVRILDNNNVATRCLVRNYDKSSFIFDNTLHTEFIKGDVVSGDLLEHIMKDCSMSINLHGIIRKSNPLNSHLFLNKYDHPYYVNYVSMNNIIDSCKRNNIERIVRMTGLATSFRNFHPISLIFDGFYSQNVHWHRQAEQAIIDSGIDYSIIRPGGIRDVFYKNVELKENRVPAPGLIDYDNLANVVIQAAFPHMNFIHNSISKPFDFNNNIIACRGI